MYVNLDAPPDDQVRSDREVAAVKQMFQARKTRLSRTTRRKIDARIRRMYEEWERNTAGQRTKLIQLSDFMEGKEEAVDFPFGPDASSNIDMRLAAGYGRMLRAQFVRAVFGDPARTYVMAKVPGVERKDLNQVEIGINWIAEHENNLNDQLRDSFIPCYRDGTGLLHGRWERRLEHGVDFKSYFNAEDFQADYPDADSAGIGESQYDEILAYVNEPQAELHVEYEIDFIAQNAPTFTLFPLAKFIHYPTTCQDIEKLGLYGYIYPESEADFEHHAKYGYYDAWAVEEVRKKSPEHRIDPIESWDRSRMAMEGIGAVENTAITYRLAWLVYAADLDGDGITERYAVIYDLDKKRSLRVELYGVRRNIPCIIPFRLVRREGRLLGVSLLGDVEHIFREINAFHRHRSNQRRITDSVTLILPEGAKDYLDLGAEYMYFRPGTVMWLPDNYMHPNMSPRQLQVQDTSRTQTSMDEEGLSLRYVDLVLGGSQGQSGRESPADPRAPARKTAMLLQRADMRVEDLIAEWSRSVPYAVDLLIALYVQNAGKEIPVMTRRGGQWEDEVLPTKLLADGRLRGKGALKPIKPSISPEIEMSRIASLSAGAIRMQVPVQMNPMILAHLWNDFVAASRSEQPERYQIQVGENGQMSMGGKQMQPGQLQQMMQGVLQAGQKPEQIAGGAPGPAGLPIGETP